jgi:hypothetical protein
MPKPSAAHRHCAVWRCRSIRLPVTVVFGTLLCILPRNAPAAINVWTSGGPQHVVVNAVAVDPAAPETVYAGTAGHGVFKSVDHGVTWTMASVGLGDIYVESVAVDPGRPETLYAASVNHGVFKSTDGAMTWIASDGGLPSRSASALAFDAAASMLYVSTADGVFKSCDGAATWVATALLTGREEGSPGEVPLHASIDCLAVDPTTRAVYACFFSWPDAPGLSWDLLKSIDGGASWQAVALPTSGGPIAIAIDAASPAAIHVATFDPHGPAYDVLSSTDGGATWESHGALPGCEGDCRIAALAVDASPAGILYAGTDQGVYRTGEGGWRPLNTGMAGQPISALAIDPTDPAVAYAGTSHGVFGIEQAARCGGDCDGDAVVTVAEVIAAVGIGLGAEPMLACAAGDLDHDGLISVSDLVGAVDSALQGCQEPSSSAPAAPLAAIR